MVLKTCSQTFLYLQHEKQGLALALSSEACSCYLLRLGNKTVKANRPENDSSAM